MEWSSKIIKVRCCFRNETRFLSNWEFLWMTGLKKNHHFVASLQVKFLDLILQKYAYGQHLFDKVCDHINLIEKEYFSLTFVGKRGIVVFKTLFYIKCFLKYICSSWCLVQELYHLTENSFFNSLIFWWNWFSACIF